jgi:hypothetical protein
LSVDVVDIDAVLPSSLSWWVSLGGGGATSDLVAETIFSSVIF